MGAIGFLLMLVGGVLAIVLGVVLIIYVVVPILKGIGWLIAHIAKFVWGEFTDVLRFIFGLIVALVVFPPLVVLNVIIGRWSAAAHFGRAVQSELKACFACLYRVFIGHPARLVGLGSVTEGFEKRLPEVMAAAPGRDKPPARSGQFEGYTIVGSLAGGGSGGRLYVAEPDPIKHASLERSGHRDVSQVVIKTFSLDDGSSLPQIVRESRALDAAKKMGLVLEHELTDERFFYVMRFVPGESLGLVTQRLHAESGQEGLGNAQLSDAMGYAADLMRTLDAYHRGGLWHKDVKPDNIIVDGKRAHLVDLGLITPLRSAMTLTTHGTEYFRDPELVRLALKGVKVHQVDGAKFDVYAAGAVLYSVVENSFPAHGGLSQVTKRCPEALKWVIRRSMTEYDKRYASMSEMLTDLHVIMTADDAFAVRMGSLPSMSGEKVDIEMPEPVVVQAASTPRPSPVAPPPPPPPPPHRELEDQRGRPSLRVADWWTGRYVVDESSVPAVPSAPVAVAHVSQRGTARPRVVRPVKANAGHPLGLTAKEQVERARGRAQSARQRAQERMSGRHKQAKSYSTNFNFGSALAVFIFLFLCVVAAGFVLTNAKRSSGGAPVVVSSDGTSVTISTLDDAPPPPAVLPKLDGRILVVKDGELSAAADREVRRFISRLENKGAEVLGAFTGLSKDDADYNEVTHVMAEASIVRDLAPIGSGDAQQRLSDWITTNDIADMLVIVHTGEEMDPDDPELWVIEKNVTPDEHVDFKRVALIKQAISTF